ncbi:MAG TPA: type II toxin-antitoxin system prevent-host-death family antitoxin [Caulobacteraceae bacterium]
MIVNIHAAKTNLSKLIERAEAGEEVIIARAGKPVARLTPVAVPGALSRKGAWIGSLRGRLKYDQNWDEPDEQLFRLMEDGPVFPTGEPET